VSIPAGIEDKTQIRLSREGEAGTNNGRPGDLYVLIRVHPHEFFKRKNVNIHYSQTISVFQATLGDTITIPTLHGTTKLTIPAGTQTGEVFALKGMGVPQLRGSGHGDQLVSVKIKIPETLDDDQRALFVQLGNLMGEHSFMDNEKGLFGKIKDAFGNEQTN